MDRPQPAAEAALRHEPEHAPDLSLAYARALAALAGSPTLAAGDVPQFARELTEQAARACGVARANVWLFDGDESTLVCVDHFDAVARSHSGGMVLNQAQFENEFRALKAAPYVAADDPLTDPRTAGYIEGYLKPNRITSMLDCVVSVSGRNLGLLCLEHVDRPHRWGKDEIAFAQRAAEKIAIAVANREARTAEETLRTSEHRFRTIFDRAPVGISECSVSGQYLSVNRRMCEITGYAPEELCARSFRDITHPEDVDRDVTNLEQLVTGQLKAYSAEKRYLRKDGRTVWVSLQVTPLRGDDGTIQTMLAIADDITARRASEAEMRMLARLPGENPNPVLRMATDGRVLYANAASQPLRESCEADIVRACIASGEKREIDMKHGDRDFAVTIAPFPAEGYANIYGTDITGRKRSEESVQASRDLLRSIIEHVPMRVFWKDQDLRYLGCNSAFAQDGGFAGMEEVVGKDDYAMSWRAQADHYRADDRKVIDSDTPKLGIEEPQTTADGSAAWLRTSKVPLHDAAGKAIGMLGIYDDVTELRQQQEDLRRTNRALRSSLEGTIVALGATMESRDPYTAGHQHRVASLASAIATEMGLPSRSAEGIYFGALIHDLGKIQVPAEILSKPGSLNKMEFALVKEHPQTGYDIVKDIDFPWPIALMMLQHHERLDGSGYPQGLKGDAIALEARILAVADVVEAMATHRPYRAGLGIDVALEQIEMQRGTWFDASAVDACLRLFREQGYRLDKGQSPAPGSR